MNFLSKLRHRLGRAGPPALTAHTVIVALAASLLALPAWAGPWRVTLDTTPLAGQVGFMAFDLVAGSPATGNTASVSNFSSNAALGAATSSGTVAGNLAAGSLTLGAGPFFNEWLQGVTAFGSSIAFDIDLGANLSAGTPDELAFFLLDKSQLPFFTSDPSGAGALFVFDLLGAATSPVIFASAFARVSIDAVPQQGVPEPATLLLTGVALLALTALTYGPHVFGGGLRRLRARMLC